MKASAGTSSVEAAHLVAFKSADILDDLLIEKAHSEFERDEAGELKFTKEAAHSCERILYRGDYTGKEIQITLLNYLKTKFSNVRFLPLIPPSTYSPLFITAPVFSSAMKTIKCSALMCLIKKPSQFIKCWQNSPFSLPVEWEHFICTTLIQKELAVMVTLWPKELEPCSRIWSSFNFILRLFTPALESDAFSE